LFKGPTDAQRVVPLLGHEDDLGVVRE
jgi:hypothetical protein